MVEGMEKLRVKCIRCGKEWEKDSWIAWGPNDISSSLCRACFVAVASPLIHRKQLLEGNFDCFGKAQDYCDQQLCKYRKWCLEGDKVDTLFPVQRKAQPPHPACSPRQALAGTCPL